MLTTRVEKLKFLVEEMELAMQLALCATDSFVSRTLARHVLVRAENFIAHARQLRKPLNNAGYGTTEFHRLKETYAKTFEDYFKTSRDRLGAHVQDFDFGKRIDLWNDISDSGFPLGYCHTRTGHWARCVLFPQALNWRALFWVLQLRSEGGPVAIDPTSSHGAIFRPLRWRPENSQQQ